MNVQASLQQLGFWWSGENLSAAVLRFQEAYCGPPTGANKSGWLALDGIWGVCTADSLAWSLNNGDRLSTNFAAKETWCKHCGHNFVRRELLSALEVLRTIKGNKPLSMLDICRCAEHNADIPGAAPDSQHIFGTGADPQTPVTRDDVGKANHFGGIGYRNGVPVCHIDVRNIWPKGPKNSGGWTIQNPSIFKEG